MTYRPTDPLDEIEHFFTPRGPRVALARVMRRAAFGAQVLAAPPALVEYLATRADAPVLRARMAAEVRRHGDVIARLELGGGGAEPRPGLSAQPIEEQYRVLATTGHLDLSGVFADEPEVPPLCEFASIMRASKYGDLTLTPAELTALMGQFTAAQQLLASRWQRLTGSALALNDAPRVGELTVRKAPIPIRPAWTEELRSREARALAAEPAAAAPPPPPPPPPPADGDAPHRCDVDDLLVRAGAAPLRPPAGDEPRYTFPGRLLQREDIFVDYGLVVPVEECGLYGREDTATVPRELDAARVLVAEATAVLDFLTQLGLAHALGAGVADTIRAALADLLATVDDATPLHQIQDWRRRLGAWAALVRAASRRSLFTGRATGSDPRDFLDRLTAALAALPSRARYQDDRIAYDVVDEGTHPVDYLRIDGRQPGPVRDAHGNMCIDNNQQVRTLGPYLEYLGGRFYTVLNELETAAAEMRDAVHAYQDSGSAIQRDFEHLATGKINEAAFVLSRLLDDLAEQLPLWSGRPAEGSKRLGLLVVFRQYWTPEGYVKGKLVGHKNLLPAEKSRVRRRTFVRTATEETTAQEFARTRQEDFSQTRKETLEVMRESATKLNLSLTASGGFDLGIGSLDVTQTTTFDLSSISRSTQSALAEAAMKSAMSYSEKREVKIREETERREELEAESELENPNQGITANYFYFQLLRQYLVSVQLHDLRPVLLRTRYVPPESAIDDRFLSDHAHVLVHVLPAQLADDLQATVHDIEALARRRLRAQLDRDDRKVAYDIVRNAGPAATPEEARDRETRLASLLEAADQAAKELHAADEAHLRARARLDRVVGHVRRNRMHYHQFLWQSAPHTDEDAVLRTERFHGTPLPELTRGLQRQGYHADEEIFDYTGPSYALVDALVRVLRPGTELAGLPRADLERTELWQQLRRQYSDETLGDLLEQIGNHAFVADPAGADAVLNSRRIQVAQDAVVIETLPGQVPLLEGYKLAHRMLDVERACLENEHLAARIADRPWQQGGEDSYRVLRRDGVPPAEEA